MSSCINTSNILTPYTQLSFFRAFCCVLILVNVFGFSCYADNSWNSLANGLEHKIIKLEAGNRLGKQLFAVRLAANRHTIKVLRAQDYGKRVLGAREICLASGALACINASFFDEKQNPLGLVISSGVVFQKLLASSDLLTSLFLVSRKGARIVSRSELDSSLSLEGIQSGPRLVTDGVATPQLKDNSESRRAGICIDKQERVILFLSSPDTRAITLSEFAQAMTTDGVDCLQGLNLDGGGSAQLFLRGSHGKTLLESEPFFDYRGQDQVPVFLAVVPALKF